MKLSLGFKGERFIYLPLSLLEEMSKNPLTGDLYIYSLGYFAKAAHHYFKRLQGCDQYILLYCKEGCGHVQIENRTYTLSPNQFIILPPNIMHQYEADTKDPWTIYWIHFKGSKAKNMTRGFDIPHSIPPSKESRIEERLNVFEEMYTTLKRGYDIDNIAYVNLCLGYFLATFLFVDQYRTATSQSEYQGSIINWAIYYMHENINKLLSIEDVASYINYSSSYFYRKFRKETGVAPMAYFTQMKINKAFELLTETDMQINQIAAMLGYLDPLYFTKVFKKVTGMSPNKYKKCHNSKK